MFAPLVFLAPIRFTGDTMDFLSMDGLAAKNGMIADNAVALLEVMPHDQGGQFPQITHHSPGLYEDLLERART